MFDSECSAAIITPFVRQPRNYDLGHRVSAVRIELENLEGKESGFAHEYAGEELVFNDDRVRLVGTPRISGRLVRGGSQVTVKGRLSAQVHVDCDRCLKVVDVPVTTDFSLPYVTVKQYEAAHAAELEDQDLGLSVFDGEAIDLDEIVREQILLAVPDRVLCRDDCKGICPVCGADRNLKDCGCQTADLDPRWAALKDLRS